MDSVNDDLLLFTSLLTKLLMKWKLISLCWCVCVCVCNSQNICVMLC